MYIPAILLFWLLSFWQANPGKPDRAYETGRAIGFCGAPVLLFLLLIFAVYALYKRSKK
jgi:hypothetical protein